MRYFSKLLTSISILSFAMFFAGCGIDGSGIMPPAERTTIKGTVYAPEVRDSSLIASIGLDNNTTSFDRFIASATLKINGNKVDYSIDNESRQLTVEGIPQQDCYELALRCNGLDLIAFIPYSSLNIELPHGFSLRSSAEWYLRAYFSDKQKLGMEKLVEYQLNSELIDSLVEVMKSELAKDSLASTSYRLACGNATKLIIDPKSFDQIMTRTGESFSYSGTFTNVVLYYIYNASGKPLALVQAKASVFFTPLGNKVSGRVKIEPIGVNPIDNQILQQEPYKIEFSFISDKEDSTVSFIRKRGADGSPLSGKGIDSWFIFPVNDGIAFQSKNVDTAYYAGITTSAGDFILKKK